MIAGETDLHEVAPNRIRHDLTHLNERDIQNLKASLRDLQADTSNDGYQVSCHGNTGKLRVDVSELCMTFRQH